MSTDEFISQMARDRDRFELDLSDALDVKASIVLLILTFLGTVSATVLLADKVPPVGKLTQIPVIVSLVISGIFCVVSLWPKQYLLDDLPQRYAEWAATLGESDSEQLRDIANLSLALAHERISHNSKLNKSKIWYLNGAFWSMSSSLFLELGAVVYLAFAIRPS